MYLTMENVFELDMMDKAKLHTPSSTLDNRIVEWVSVIETPVENFVRKNEFVLSTGIGCGHDEDLFYQFIHEVIDSGASGIAIAEGRYIEDIPQSILNLATEHNFPILTIPWEIRFAEIIQGILQALNNQKNMLVENSEKLQQQLLNIILQGGSLPEIATFIFKKLKQPLLITDKRGIVKSKSKSAKSLHENWNKYLHTEEYAISLTPFENSNFSVSPNIRFISIESNTILHIIIQSSSEIQGYLIIGGNNGEDLEPLLEPAMIQLIEHAATAIALCFLKENTIHETEMRLRDDFVWGLAKEPTASWDQILSRAKSLGYNVNLPYLCIIGHPENLNDIYKKQLDETSYEHWLQTVSRRMEDEIFYTSRAVYCKTMTTFQHHELIIFLEVKNNNINQTVSDFLEILDKRMKQLFPTIILSYGIGKKAGVHVFHDSYQEAQMALEIGRRQKGPGHQTTYADTRIDRALMNLVQNNELKQITDSTVSRLIKYEEERGIELINTYKTYSRNRGNVSQTARELNLHRQSLLYRLRKVESLTGCSLENPDDIFLIDLSIRLWTVGILEA